MWYYGSLHFIFMITVIIWFIVMCVCVHTAGCGYCLHFCILFAVAELLVVLTVGPYLAMADFSEDRPL